MFDGRMKSRIVRSFIWKTFYSFQNTEHGNAIWHREIDESAIVDSFQKLLQISESFTLPYHIDNQCE